MYGDCQVMHSSSMMLIGGGAGGAGGGAAGGGLGVISSGGGNMVLPSDPFFSSPIRNPNTSLNSFMASINPYHPFAATLPKVESGLVRKEEEMESGGSGSGHMDGGGSCGEEQVNSQEQQQQPQLQSQQQQTQKKKRYHRHTTRQIQEMEALFKECPHPDDKQRMKLSQELGLKPRQVKFWFQNRRTQMKAQQDRADNAVLRAENENLKCENFRLQAAMSNVACPNCGGPAMIVELSFEEQHLRLENARLKEELDRLSCIAARCGARTMLPAALGPAAPMMLPSLDLDMGIYSRHFGDTPVGHCTDIIPGGAAPENCHQQFAGYLIIDEYKQLALDLAMTAAEQLVRMCRLNEPLWTKNGGGGSKEGLDVEEHARMFPWPIDLKPNQQQQGGFRIEATRDSTLVIMNSITLVDSFLNVNKWMDMFPSIVSSARTIQVISSGISGHGNGALHLMHAELQVLSPLVPTREAHFLRYCQQNAEEGIWTIVDFPIDGFHDELEAPSVKYRRRPSGCIIQDMPNGYSKVTWVEHAEVEDKPVHQIFNRFVTAGMAFGAQRWLADLQRHCERLASLLARNISDLGVISTADARTNMMKLSQRMVRTFGVNIGSSGAQSWTALSDSCEDTIRISTRKNTEHGQPSGVILTAVSTTWLPFSHQEVFDLLTDERRRTQLDVISGGNSLHEVAHIANGSHPRNCASLLRINSSSNSSQNVELMLQESSTHPTGGSLVVWGTVDVQAVQVMMSGDDTSYIPILPIGFVVLPAASPATADNTTADSPDGSGTRTSPIGCLLTVGLQVLASAVPSAKLNLSSVTAINNHLCNAVHQITTALGSAVTKPMAGSSMSATSMPEGVGIAVGKEMH